jgi:hypothetical protein
MDELSEKVENLRVGKEEEDENDEFAIPDYPSDSKPSEIVWKSRFARDFGEELVSKRPTPMPWFQHYLHSLKVDPLRGVQFANKMKQIVSFSVSNIT